MRAALEYVRNGEWLRLNCACLLERAPFYRCPVLVRQTDPGLEPHHPTRVEDQHTGTVSSETADQAIDCGAVNVGRVPGAADGACHFDQHLQLPGAVLRFYGGDSLISPLHTDAQRLCRFVAALL